LALPVETPSTAKAASDLEVDDMGARVRRIIAVGAMLGLVAACGGGGGDEDAGDDDEPAFQREESTFDDEAEEADDAAEQQTEGIDLEDVPVEDQDDVIILAALDELETFWDDEFSTVASGGFQPVGGGFFPYGPDTEIPGCGQTLAYEDVAQNAFYCPIDDTISWDTENLTNGMLEEFGPFSLVIVMAHEYGHAIQARGALNPALPTVAGEQQADCFAGAFTAFVNDGGSDVLNLSLEDLDSAVAGFLSLRDAPGTPTDDPSAHGSGFDRVAAFQDGFLSGSERCAEYEDIFEGGGSTAIPLVFQSEEDFQSGGNAPFDADDEADIFDLTFGSLETFWIQAMEQQFGAEWNVLFPDQIVAFSSDDPDSLPDCGGTGITAEDAAGQAFTCFGDPEDPSDDFIAFDIDLAAALYEEVGDFAVSGIISQQYSFVAQVLLGNLENDKPSFLQADCFSGAWTGEVTIQTLTPDVGPDGEPVPGSQELIPEVDPSGIGGVSISAGDLDEAVQSFLLLGQDNDPDVEGTTFERVAAFRDGFLNGLDSCETYLDGGVPSEEDGVPDAEG
jgi:predicted metalloprotease